MTAYASIFYVKAVNIRSNAWVEKNLGRRERSLSDQPSADRSCGQKSRRHAPMRKSRKVRGLERKEARERLYGLGRLGSVAVIRAIKSLSWRSDKESGMNCRNEPYAP